MQQNSFDMKMMTKKIFKVSDGQRVKSFTQTLKSLIA